MPEHKGEIIHANLKRLGYVREIVDLARISKLVNESLPGEGMSRQRIATILRSPRVRDETVEKLARALGVTVKQLTRRP